MIPGRVLDIKPLVGKLTNEGIRAYGVVPLAIEDKTLVLGVSEVTKHEQLDSLRQRLKASGYEVAYKFTSILGWQRLMNRYSIAVTEDLLVSGNFEELNRNINNIEPKFMFEPLVQIAYQLGSSDIHIEPAEKMARLRFRVDGVLHPIIYLSTDRYELFVSDIQIRAGVKWGSDEPQAGRLQLPVINEIGDIIPLNMRLETVPSLHGQDVVIRLFNLTVQYLKIENLGLEEHQLKTLIRATSHPRGLVVSVGPTGSGKTSTLYSVMNRLNTPERKIVTLEDPVEYELEGVSQIPVESANHELFMEKLRAVLREDPDIIMIGEIRDADTARTALQAALTGHLVLTTFHASTGAAAITRLMDMIGQNPLLASSVRLIMAQRLVRKLCEVCKVAYEPSKEEFLQVKTVIDEIPEKSRPSIEGLKLYKVVGCDKCHHFGYDGRLSVMEQFDMSPKLEEIIGMANNATTTQVMERAAVEEGMITLLQDGMLKVVDGHTTLEEVYTAVGE
jgi:type IV pilus assembly protein PilB